MTQFDVWKYLRDMKPQKTIFLFFAFLVTSLPADFPLQADPFAFEDIRSALGPMPSPEWIKATDGVRLALFPFPAKRSHSTLLLIHGGGAHSAAGYGQLATELQNEGVSVYLLDLRGHGRSDGERGDTPSVEQMMQDLSIAIKKIQSINYGPKIILGGHSSGGGLVLNYSAWESRESVDGYIFLSPEFGYQSNTERSGREEFAIVRTWVFILNAISGGSLLGHTRAVTLQYPEYILKEDPLLINKLTCNMALALTPANPHEQFASLDRPFALFVGEEDELFDPEALIQYGQLPSLMVRQFSMTRVLPGKKHLSILMEMGDSVFQSIQTMRKF